MPLSAGQARTVYRIRFARRWRPLARLDYRLYAVTANGSTDEVTAWSENVLRLKPDLSVADWFSPSDYQTLNDDDEDPGSSGALLVPGTIQLITGRKQGLAYLLNSGSLGHETGSDTQIPQSFNAANIGLFNMAFWNNSLYSFGGAGRCRRFRSTAGNSLFRPVRRVPPATGCLAMGSRCPVMATPPAPASSG